MRSNLKRAGLSLIIGILCLSGILQAKEYLETTYNYTRGLSQSQVWSVIEDEKGYLWVGTQYGLSRFNGYEFRNFYTQHGLPSSIIYDLETDRLGNLWIGTSNGISRWDGKTFKTFRMKGDRIVDSRDLHITRDGKIYFITIDSLGVVRGDNLYSLDGEIDLCRCEYTCITSNAKGELFIGTSDAGVFKIRGNKTFSYNFHNNRATVSALFWDEDESALYIGTDDGLYILQNEQIFLIESTAFLRGHDITSIRKTHHQSIVISVYDKGVYELVDTNWNRIYTSTQLLINTLFTDSVGNIWVGKDGGGLIRLSESPFQNIRSGEGGAINGYPMAIEEAPDGSIWIATTRFGVYHLEDRNDINPEHYIDFLGASGNIVRSIVVRKDNSVWMGTAGGIAVLKDRKFKTYSTQNGLTNKTVRNIYEDSEGMLWISTDYGITLYRDGEFSSFKGNNRFHHKNITQVTQDNNGVYWIATLGGLYKFDGDKLSRYKPPDYPNDMQVETIFIDSQNTIWIGGVDGLAQINPDGDFKRFGIVDGFDINFIYFIIEGKPGEIWIGTGNGLYRYFNEQFHHYTEQNGLVGIEANARAALKDRAGKLWFGFLNGISIYKEIEKYAFIRSPVVYIDELIVDGSKVNVSGKVELPYTSREFFFRFHSIALNPAHRVQYQYQLSPLDDSWSVPTNQRFKQYSYLKPGHYQFRVKAIINNETESLLPGVIEFYIVPPIWLRWWFIISTGLLIATIITLFVFLRLRRLEREKAALHEAVKERTRELEEKNKELESFAYTVSHDLKDPVGVIVGYAQVMEDFLKKKKVSGANHFLEGIKRNSDKIVRFIDDLLQLSRSGKVVEKFTETDVRVIVGQIKKELIEKGRIKKENLTFRKLPKVNADFDRLYLVFLNLIKNAYKYRARGRKLKITITYERLPDAHLFKIKDNGIGIEAEMIDEIFKPGVRLKSVDTVGSGFGLRIVQKIVEAHRGKIWVESQVGKGSTFYFTIGFLE